MARGQGSGASELGSVRRGQWSVNSNHTDVIPNDGLKAIAKIVKPFQGLMCIQARKIRIALKGLHDFSVGF